MSVRRPEPGVLSRVRAASALLGPGEGRVAAVVLARPDDVVEWSTAELASAAGTSTATVIRACQRMGFRGFQHLRLEVARSAPLAPREPEHEGSLFDDAVDALRIAQECADPRQLDAAADALAGARRTVLVGHGFSGPPLQDLAMRLSTIGHVVEAPIDPQAQQFTVQTLAPGDVCLALSYSGANVQTLRACSAAGERGATVVLVTSYARSPLGRVADVVISTGPAGGTHDVDPFLARIGHTVALHAILVALARRPDRPDVSGMRHVVADALTEG
ncbi:MurR/RpiR family transcriptional regulator [Pseudonocardia sp. NPDC049635]|uniref:MurR/RpiR family transcriptional regulator n=1 Tax=Pseudonocardia sp. NPDC049635 TaxID=3155506 RepID=UPI0033DDF1BA